MTTTAAACAADGCSERATAKGYCAVHYQRVRRTGSTELTRARKKCNYPGCDKWRDSWGYCSTHRERIRKHGSPDIVKRGGPQRREGHTVLLNSGYLTSYAPEHPLATPARAQLLVHRMVLFDVIGPGTHSCHICGRSVTWGAPLPRRLEVDHLDANRVNNDPANLAPCCHKCNSGQAKRTKKACPRGHEYKPETTYISPDGYRRCRICMREADRRRRPPGSKR